MQPVPHRCPICRRSEIVVTEVECPQCQSQIKGHFALHRLNRLTADQLQFVEIFLLNEGKINRVEQEMGLSYAAVRTRLQEIVTALGGSTATEEVTIEENVRPASPTGRSGQVPSIDRKTLLARVSAGELSAAEAVALLGGEAAGLETD